MTEFSGPASMSNVEWKTYYGHLLVLWPYGREEVVTRFGEKAAVRCDLYDLDADGEAVMDVLVFPRALVMQLSGVAPGKAVVGRLGQGESRGGQSPPWKLANPTPDDLQRASAHFANRPARIHSVLGKRQASAQSAAPSQNATIRQSPTYPAPPAMGQTPGGVTFDERPPF